MNKFVRALIAAWGAKKVGGGCLTTIIVFFIIYYALGTCNRHSVQPSPKGNSGVITPAHNKTAFDWMNQNATHVYVF